MKIVFAAGGTGGHVYPALALADYISQEDKDTQCFFIGSKTRIEKTIISQTDYSFIGLDIPSVYSFLTKIRLAFKMPFAYFAAKRHLKAIKPDIVIGTGGFISFPVVKAAQHLKIPTILHEQNAIIGKANKKLLKKASAIITCYESVVDKPNETKIYLLGNPRATQVANQMKHVENIYDVLIFMGSQGSSKIDDLLFDNLAFLDNQAYKTLYVCGKAYYERYQHIKLKNVSVKAYDDDMIMTMMKSRIIVCRAGATSLAELCVLKHPLILIPSPHVVDNHQFLNAKQLADKQACIMLVESELTGEKLVNEITDLLSNTKKQTLIESNIGFFAKENAAKDIYHVINETIGEL